MKIALGMIVLKEEMFLNRHLPIIAPCFENFIVVDGGSTDKTLDILKKHNATIVQSEWHNHFADQRNVCKNKAEEMGMDWLFMLDADECMFPEHIKDLFTFMYEPDNEFLVLPRIEFYGDAKHYKPKLYPDYQGRAIRLRLSYHWRYAKHNAVWKGDDSIPAWDKGYQTIVPTAQIFHYGWALEPRRRHIRYYQSEPIKPFLKEDGLKLFTGRQPV